MRTTTAVLKASCAVLLALALVGCATKLSTEDRAALKRVSIGAIQLPDKPYVLPPGSGGAFLLGGAAGMALTSAASDMPTAFRDHVAKNKIDLSSYVRADLASQLRTKGFQVVTDESQADAALVVQLLQYGLTGTMTSDDRFPLLQLRLSLVNKKGDRVWLGFAASSGIEGITKMVEQRPIPDFFKDPKLLDREFRKVTTIVVSSATKDL